MEPGEGEYIMISGKAVEVEVLTAEQATIVLDSGLCDVGVLEEIHSSELYTPDPIRFLLAYCRAHWTTFGEVLVIA